MQVRRCPECGNRLKSDYCHICMKRIPYLAQQKDTSSTHREEAGHTCVSFDDPWEAGGKKPSAFQRLSDLRWNRDASSSHREEKHTCVTFDTPRKTEKNVFTRIGDAKQQRRQAKNGKKQVKTAAIVIAVMSVVSSLFSAVDSETEVQPEPEYAYGEYIYAGDQGAEGVPGIESTELFNNGPIVITADSAGLFYEDYAIAVTIMNESEQDITVSTDLMCINGYMIASSGLFTQVESGETLHDYLIAYSFDLEEAGIKQVAQMAFTLDIYDSEEYTDIAQTDLITLDTQIVDDYIQPVDDSGWELYNEDGLRIVLRSTEVSDYDDCSMILFLENETDRMVCLYDNGITLNGQGSSGVLWSTLLPHTRAIEEIYLYDLAALGIEDVSDMEEMTVELQMEYMTDWYVEESQNVLLTFSPAEFG